MPSLLGPTHRLSTPPSRFRLPPYCLQCVMQTSALLPSVVPHCLLLQLSILSLMFKDPSQCLCLLHCPCHPQLATLAHGLECLSHTWIHFLNLVSAIVSSLILRHSNPPFALRNLPGTHLPSELSHIILNSLLLPTLGLSSPWCSGLLGKRICALESPPSPYTSGV